MVSAEELMARFALEPGTCGFMAKTFDSPLQVAAGSGQMRSIGAALYFLVTSQRGIAAHRIRSDQVYHHYAGDPLEVLLLHEAGEVTQHVVGSDVARGMRPQLLIPAGAFHFGRLVEEPQGAGWAMLGTTSWPAVAEGEFEDGDVAELSARYPAARGLIAEFGGGRG